MRLLVLGGTRFVGRHIVRAALNSGHDVTLFNRGRSNPGLFPETERLQGDRTKDLSALGKGSWDAVLDTSGYFPADVRRSCDALVGAAAHYTYISTISVYEEGARSSTDESTPVARLDGVEDATETAGASYGPLKALCEEVVESRWPKACTIIRPGLVVGPHDPSERFTYWPRRIAGGGRVLAPGRPERPVQFIDGRDLGEWAVAVTERKLLGTYNAVGPGEELSMGEFLRTCVSIIPGEAELVWVDDRPLLDAGIEPWTGLPLWLPGDHAEGSFDRLDSTRAMGAGLTFRPLETTVKDTLEWDLVRPDKHKSNALARAREAEILAAQR